MLHFSLCIVALYEWRPTTIIAREDEGLMEFDLCTSVLSGTLTFPINVNVRTNEQTATGRLILINVYPLYVYIHDATQLSPYRGS